MTDDELIRKLDSTEHPFDRAKIVVKECQVRLTKREGITAIGVGLPDAALVQFIVDLNAVLHKANLGLAPTK